MFASHGRPALPGLLLFPLFLLPLLAGACRPATDLVILHTSDHHGRLYAFRPPGAERPAGGLARRGTLVGLVRAEGEREGFSVLLLDAGDFNTGVPESDRLKARPDLEAMAAMGYDAAAVGNHEFDPPWEEVLLGEQQAGAGFPFLAANVRRAADGERLFPPCLLRSAGGARLAIVGLTTTETPHTSKRGGDPALSFTDPAAELEQLLVELEGQYDFLVVLSHLGGEADRDLAAQFPEIGLIVGGHTHTPLARPERVGDCWLVRSGAYGLNVGRVELARRGGGLRPVGCRLLPVTEELAPDPAILARLPPPDPDVYVGYAAGDFARDDLAGPRASSTLGNLVADAMRDGTGADVALQNSGALRAGLPAGWISEKDVRLALPFANRVHVFRLAGRDLRRVIARTAELESENVLYQAAGLSFAIAGGEARILVGGEPLDDEAEYTVAVNSFIAGGGDRYALFREWEPERVSEETVSDLVIGAFRARRALVPDRTLRCRRQ